RKKIQKKTKQIYNSKKTKKQIRHNILSALKNRTSVLTFHWMIIITANKISKMINNIPVSCSPNKININIRSVTIYISVVQLTAKWTAFSLCLNSFAANQYSRNVAIIGKVIINAMK